MHILGIETSCDETAAAVVKDGVRVLSNIVSSSVTLHSSYGGIIPEIAFRQQLEAILPVVDESLKRAKTSLKNINAISVTQGPGLLGSLLVGISFAKSLSLASGLPLVGVDHIKSHLYACYFSASKIKFPYIGLIVSGGHTSLYKVEDFNDFKLLGCTRDDACGEAFDKVARLLDLGYPGGPVIERKAQNGNSKSFSFRCFDSKEHLDFSFSGIKTSVLYLLRDKGFIKSNSKIKIPETLVADICASFQESVTQALIYKSLLACKKYSIPRLVTGGGVLANNYLRSALRCAAQNEDVQLFLPEKCFCTDNAAMISGLGYQLFKKKIASGLDLSVS